MSRKPETYWEDRAIQAEQATIDLAKILYAHFPAMHPELDWWKNEWNRVHKEVERAYPEEPPKQEA